MYDLDRVKMLSLLSLALCAPSLSSAFSFWEQSPSPHSPRATKVTCRCFPRDACWPTTADWTAFNKTIGGKLVATIPLAAPCHNDPYAAYSNATCSALQAGWLEPQTHYNGKSTGSGSLAIWTHHLKSITFSDWSDASYTGKAIKVGAGVMGIEAYEAADARGLQVVGGECPTVGIAGGYTQGGGHSALASKHGLAADQVLEWEVVTGTGEHLIANRGNNTDLYWALSGGGGGTYGVALSMTSKAHPDTPTSAMNLTFLSAGTTQDKYYEAISAFHASLPALVDAGAMSVWYFTNASFAISPITGPNVTQSELRKLLTPLTSKLKALGIAYTSYFGAFPGYLQEYHAMQGPINVGIAQYGGRLIPRDVVLHDNSALTDAYRFINNHGGQFIGVGVNVSMKVAGDVDNAVNPGWRTALIDTVLTTPWNFTAPLSEMVANQHLMTDVFIPKLAALTPNGSCYLNEGEPDFQEVFYGTNYARLLRIKNKYDPHHMFWAITAVGSEWWTPKGGDDGRLCH
ncbi:hypothetical protein LTR53_007396 [Teratosphaeriaceae sp. CCFEE 6253]|nr:hypothetical protein LTR53_007396 [Teratosphaeriaceae sp. CCFEE 6253]